MITIQNSDSCIVALPYTVEDDIKIVSQDNTKKENPSDAQNIKRTGVCNIINACLGSLGEWFSQICVPIKSRLCSDSYKDKIRLEAKENAQKERKNKRHLSSLYIDLDELPLPNEPFPKSPSKGHDNLSFVDS